MLSRAKKRQSQPVPIPICLQNLRKSPAHLKTSSSCRSGRQGGPEISRDTPSININRFRAIPDRFRYLWKIVYCRSFWSFWWLGESCDFAFRSRAYLSLILTHWNSNQGNSMLSSAKKRHSPPVPICLQNLRNSPAHLETSSSCRSGRPRGPKMGRDTPGININRFQAIPDRFKHFWKIVHFRSFW